MNIKLNQNIISYNSLNKTLQNNKNNNSTTPCENLTQNYLLINNILFDLNQTKFTNLHNYAKFKNFDSLVITKQNSNKSLVENYCQFIIENNYKDTVSLKDFF